MLGLLKLLPLIAAGNWIGVVMGVMNLVRELAGFLHDKGLIEAGEAKAIKAGLEATQEELRKVQAIRAEAEADHAAGKLDTEFERKDE